MRYAGLVAITALAALAGCKETPAYFLHEPAAADTALSDPALTGHWRIEPLPDPASETPAAEQPDTAPSTADAPPPRRSPEATLRVELEGVGYAIVMTRGRRTESFTARLYEIDGQRYFAARLTDRYVTSDSAQHYRAPVAVFRIDAAETAEAAPFNLSFLTQRWVDGRRNAGALAIAHTKVDDVPVIIADTAETAAFIASASAIPEAWQPLGAALTPLGE